jgi:predicted metal-dependent peptidase
MAKVATSSSASSAQVTIGDLIAKARWQAARKAPYFSKSLWAAVFIETPEVPTIAVDDKWRIYYNPDYVKKCASEDTLVGELLHEVLHPTFRHKSRAATIHAEDHKHWNCCGDAEIDQKIEAMGVQLVKDRITPKVLGGTEGMTAEELYRLPRKEGKQGKPKCSGGSGTGSQPGAWEAKADAAKDGPPGLSEGEADIVRAATAQACREHEKSKPGSVPAGVLRWAEEFLDAPPVDWRSLVAARVRYAIDTKRGASPSYARPSRRHYDSMVLPIHRAPIPNVHIVIDTSGSMQENDIGQALTCVFDACETLGNSL